MPPMILVEDLVKRYRQAETNAVDGISFSVEPGELFALLGPNGAGKTTTISILTTTLLPTSGQVTIAGHDVVRKASDVRQEVGIIFQKPSLDGNLTAEENVRFHAILYGEYGFRPSFRTMPALYQKEVRQLAEVLGIQDDLFTPVKRLSGGMKRKLEIVRSLIHRPLVLFLDEPTTGLDPASRRNLWEYLRETRSRHDTTVFLTTHYLEEAEGADRICIVNKGKVVSYGTPAQVKADLIELYVLVDAEDRDALQRELLRLGFPYGDGDGTLIRIDLDGRSAHSVLRSIETPLSVVQTHTPSLEDAYLEILGRS